MAEKCDKCCKCTRLFHVMIVVILLINTYFMAGIWMSFTQGPVGMYGMHPKYCPFVGKPVAK